MKNKLKVLGIMSGSSLDGIDMAWVEFSQSGGVGSPYHYKWLNTQFCSYDPEISKDLHPRPDISATELLDWEVQYTKYQAEILKKYRDPEFAPELIAWHGHTWDHQPHKGYSVQLGRGELLGELTGTPVCYDFRNADIAKEGQGAPLAPIVDHHFFSDHDYCLNLGGICNITVNDDRPVAYDVCGFNQVLNYLANQLGFPMDENGSLSSSGKVVEDLRTQMNSWSYLQRPAPKSLSNHEVAGFYLPLLDRYNLPIADKMKTFLRHVCDNIQSALKKAGTEQKMLLSGGGAYNKTFRDLLMDQTGIRIAQAPEPWNDFKEAFLMAFMGYLKWFNQVNILSSVTGSREDHSSGILYRP